MRKYFLSGLCLLALFIHISVKGQLFINEFVASNSAGVEDPDFSESADWIEIYNAGSSAVSLQGYYLTDNLGDPSKFKITTNIEIPAGGYQVIWADGYDNELHASFKLSADGEEIGLYNANGELLDSIIYGIQKTDLSFGRKTDGSNTWVYFESATPGSKNTGISYTNIVYSVPTFSIEGGIYSSPQSVEIKSLFGGDVRYTIDGSEPGLQSSVALGQLSVSETTIIRARIYKPGQLLGPVVTHTYFIDPENEIGHLPVISIASDPDNFWGSEKGIYAQSEKPDWEVPVNIELFENDGSDRAAFNLGAGIKINGLYSWQLPQKMLGVYFRKQYGAGKLEYPLIYEKERKSFDDFALRASGSDWGSTLFRDGIIQRAAVYNTNIDNSGFRSCVVYINGQFMGIHNIREKIDEDYIVGNYGLEGGTFDMVEETDRGPVPETGDGEAYSYLFELAAQDLKIPENWNAIANEMDIEEFTDLVCTEAFDGNGSIGHNLMAWKPKDTGKWKWILMDLDRGFPGLNSQKISFYLNESGWPFKSLMQNDDYKKYFGRRLADHLFTTYNPARIVPMIEEHENNIAPLMPKQIARWLGTSGTGNYSSIKAISSYSAWQSNVEYLKTYAQGRAAVLLNDLTNYGFNASSSLSVSSFPIDAGNISFNGLVVPFGNCSGAYPNDEEIKLVASAKAGYVFKGWQGSGSTIIIPKESEWKYYDQGNMPDANWQSKDYNDSSWDTGQAQFGYGDDDENTVIDYGPSSSNKYVTAYFRKSFSVADKSAVQSLDLSIMCDDGAVVYLNGQEIIRQNMPVGEVDFSTLASNGVTGTAESTFTNYSIDPSLLLSGANTLAVEIHQTSLSSSDVSFDLELNSYGFQSANYLSVNPEYTFVMNGVKNISAVFEATGQCIVDAVIDAPVTLSADCSPYLVNQDVTITSTGKLTIEPGVELHLSGNVSIYANGPIIAEGTAGKPIRFIGDPNSADNSWGTISIKNVEESSSFKHVVIEDATSGKHPVREIAAISLFHTKINMDHLTIENVYGNPIIARYSDVTLTNSTLHSSITGDLINVKYGKGYIANCTFIGNDMPDTDAIDYDDVENGVIRNCTIKDFHGFNSDAIDIGEKAKNITIDSVFVYNITDKGVSVGQQSSAHISYSVFTNCNLGAGLKDSCYVTIDHCTYYGTNIAVACYEKNIGDAGGNAFVTNTIMSNSYTDTYLVDDFSQLDISYSISDNDRLPDGRNNLYGDPRFTSPTYFDFALKSTSPALNTGSTGNMGADLSNSNLAPNLLITDIGYYTDATIETPEFVGITNVSDDDIDISGYKITRGFTYEFPAGTKLRAHQRLFITDNANASFWSNKTHQLYEWETGRLADEGETIQLETDEGIILDGVKYNNKAPWPEFDKAMLAIYLSSYELDNHFGENWNVGTLDAVVNAHELADNNKALFFPNPSKGILYYTGNSNSTRYVSVYNLSGEKLKTVKLNENETMLDLSDLQSGMYLLECAGETQRIIRK